MVRDNDIEESKRRLDMLEKEDNTYNDLREKAIDQWLDGMSLHEDIAVRGGVKVTTDYIKDLKREITMLENKNSLKNKYLKQLKER